MRQATLCFLVDGRRVLLGMKKRGFGQGKWNGFGGKVLEGEGVEEATKREVFEEIGVEVRGMEKVAELHFTFPYKPEWDQLVRVFLAVEWEGKPAESEEMRPEWFEKEKLPFAQMWSDDEYWLPRVLDGEKIVGRFVFKQGEQLENQEVSKVEGFG